MYKPGHDKVNTLEDEGDEEDFPKIIDYCFSVDISGVIFAMHDLGYKVRWLRKGEKSTTWKDKSK